MIQEEKYKYEIHIGEAHDINTSSTKPRNIIIITEDQFAIIEQFADIRKGNDLMPIYKINEVEFRIVPYINFNL